MATLPLFRCLIIGRGRRLVAGDGIIADETRLADFPAAGARRDGALRVVSRAWEEGRRLLRPSLRHCPPSVRPSIRYRSAAVAAAAAAAADSSPLARRVVDIHSLLLLRLTSTTHADAAAAAAADVVLCKR